MMLRTAARLAAVLGALVALTACGSSSTPSRTTLNSPTAAPSSTPTSPETPALSSPPLPSSMSLLPTVGRSAVATVTSRVAAAGAPVIVIDPGHSPTINHTDAATGLNDSDYENEPEMRDVFAVALLVKSRLEAAGYRVVMTKNSATERISLGQRAAVANAAHAALAISIHDQGGSNGGIPFATGNNIVYYQAVGDYRATPSGTKITFTDGALAATSARYGQVFQGQRAAAEGHSVRLQGDTGYDLGSRGLAAGNIWIVQLLAQVPWIYNEAGGNSAGQSGLSAADEQKYATGLVAAAEICVPI
jgi:N-acetylmuramoyl-L-alanine amidase